MVVDLVGGWADEARTRTWQPDTMVNVYSVGKAIVGLLALQLVDAGLIDLDAPIADVWPEFAAGGKEGATLRHALSPPGGRARDPRAADEPRPVGLGADDRSARRHRGVVRAGYSARLPHEHLRPSGGWRRAPGDRRDAECSVAGGRPTRCEPTCGSACPAGAGSAAPT